MTAREMVERSRTAQGLPPTVEDAETLARIAQLLTLRRDEAPTEAGASATVTTSTRSAKRGGRRGTA